MFWLAAFLKEISEANGNINCWLKRLLSSLASQFRVLWCRPWMRPIHLGRRWETPVTHPSVCTFPPVRMWTRVNIWSFGDWVRKWRTLGCCHNWLQGSSWSVTGVPQRCGLKLVSLQKPSCIFYLIKITYMFHKLIPLKIQIISISSRVLCSKA